MKTYIFLIVLALVAVFLAGNKDTTGSCYGTAYQQITGAYHCTNNKGGE